MTSIRVMTKIITGILGAKLPPLQSKILRTPVVVDVLCHQAVRPLSVA